MSGLYLAREIKHSIRRDIYFNIQSNDRNYLLTSYFINKFTSIDNIDDELLDDILPGFFIYKDYSIYYTITKQNNDGYLFSNGSRPVFFCSTT